MTNEMITRTMTDTMTTTKVEKTMTTKKMAIRPDLLRIE